MSGVKVATATVTTGTTLLGPIGWLILGAIALGAMSSESNSSSKSYSYHDKSYERELQRERETERQRKLEAERQQRLEEERKQAIRKSWKRINHELQKQIDGIKSTPEHERLTALLHNAEQSYIHAIENGDSSSAESLINHVRQDIISIQTEEEIIASRQDELSRLLSELERKAPAGFARDIKSLLNSGMKPSTGSIEEQNRNIRAIMSKAQSLASEISIANSISVDALIEETFIIPPVVTVEERAQQSSAEDVTQRTSLLQDIYDFGGRIAFFDEHEAEKLRPLIVEAKSGTGTSRLKLIRTQVKTTYNRLREEAILTDMFKRDIHDFLSPMRKAIGTEKLCARMEDLLTAAVISRDEYNEIYKAVRIVLSEQLETITDAFFAEKIALMLNGMGYGLLDENGNPADLPLDTMRMIETPYEGYRVRVKVGHDNSVVTRLVRVVGSEEEKAATSEYQRQQDIEICKKWRENIMEFYRTLEDDGIKMNIVYSKEPEEEPLDVVVDKSFQRQRRTSTAEHQQEQLQERGI